MSVSLRGHVADVADVVDVPRAEAPVRRSRDGAESESAASLYIKI